MRKLILSTLLGLGTLGVANPSTAHASWLSEALHHSQVTVSFGPQYPAPVYVPTPVYPVYRPVPVYTPAPVYAPVPAYRPAPVYVPGYSQHGPHHHGHHHHGWHQHNWRR